MKVFGIDLGSRYLGWSIVEETRNPYNIRYIDSGVFIAPAKYGIYKRLSILEEELNTVLQMFNPDEIAFEKGYTKNKSEDKFSTAISSEKVAYSRGVFGKCAAKCTGKEPIEVPINTIKKLVTGQGNADKELVRNCIRARFRRDFSSHLDETDAVAIAVAAAHQIQMGFYEDKPLPVKRKKA